MTCSEFRTGIQEHLDTRGERTLSEELVQHHSACPSCADYWKDLQVIHARLQRAPRVELPAGLIHTLYGIPKQRTWVFSLGSVLRNQSRQLMAFASAAVVYAIGVILFPHERIFFDLALVTFGYTLAFSSLLSRPILGMRR